MTEQISVGGEYLDLDLDAVGFRDALAVEQYLGVEWLDFLKSLAPAKEGEERPQISKMATLQVLTWLARLPREPGLKIEDVNDPVAKFELRSDQEADADPLPSGSEDSNVDTASSSTSSTESAPGSGSD